MAATSMWLLPYVFLQKVTNIIGRYEAIFQTSPNAFLVIHTKLKEKIVQYWLTISCSKCMHVATIVWKLLSFIVLSPKSLDSSHQVHAPVQAHLTHSRQHVYSAILLQLPDADTDRDETARSADACAAVH